MAGLTAQTRQLIGSLLVAAIIVAVTILVVSARLPAGAGDDDHGGKDRQEQREDRSGEDR